MQRGKGEVQARHAVEAHSLRPQQIRALRCSQPRMYCTVTKRTVPRWQKRQLQELKHIEGYIK